jgi:hypothetical protein
VLGTIANLEKTKETKLFILSLDKLHYISNVKCTISYLVRVVPMLAECRHFSHFFYQIQANNAILHYFMVRFNTFLDRVVAFLLTGGRGRPVPNTV